MNTVRLQDKNLCEAFDLVKVKLECSQNSQPILRDQVRINLENYVVTEPIFLRLIQQAEPQRSDRQIKLLYYILCSSRSNHRLTTTPNRELYLEKSDFLNLAQILNQSISEMKDRMGIMDKYFPKFYFSKPSQLIISAVKQK